ETASGGGISQAGRAEGKQDRRRTPVVGSRAYDDRDPAEIRRVAGDRIHQGQERDTLGAGLWRKEEEPRRPTLLGSRVLRIDSRARRRGDPRIHQKSRKGG